MAGSIEHVTAEDGSLASICECGHSADHHDLLAEDYSPCSQCACVAYELETRNGGSKS
jgi:hypothetical protein